MCSAGSSNVNILHPPSHSPVPEPGIPLPSNGRLVPTLFLFLSVSVAHKRTQTYSLFVPMQLLQTNYFLPSFLTYLPHTFLHFLSAATPSFILPSFHLFFLLTPPTTLNNNNPPSPSRSLSFSCSLILGLFAWQSVKDADSVQRAGPARALLCPSRPGLRFVMLDNARQCRDKKPRPPQTKRALFFPLFPFHRLLHFSHGDAEFSGPFLLAGRGMKIVERKKIVPPSLIYSLGAEYILYKAKMSI